MSDAVELWNEFVARGVDDSRMLADGIRRLIVEESGREIVPELAYVAFSVASQALLLGAHELGRLAAACERCLGFLEQGQMDPGQALPLLAKSIDTMGAAFAELAAADQSGARIEKTPVEAARYEIETLLPIPGTQPARPANAPDIPVSSLRRRPPTTPPRASRATDPMQPANEPPSQAPSPSTWTPQVDEDMIDLFFEEASDRLDALSSKLLEIEQRPDDPEILRDLFRDLHTVKGSSAMVGLTAMTQIAHAAEDLVGQLRDGHRRATSAVVDTLLAGLDALRRVASAAQEGRVLPDADAAVLRLRNPDVASSGGQEGAPAGAPMQPLAETAARTEGRQTIRVDFDKLDNLMNLVGELVLGRDGLSGAIGALSALSTEVSTSHHMGRRVAHAGTARGSATRGREVPMTEIGEELGRVERVLVDIFQELDSSAGRLSSISGELRDSVMALRMIPVGGIFRKHKRTVRDLAGSLGKQVRLELQGEDTELDKLLVEALDEPLMHLVRNSVDHGIEKPADRVRTGKPETGTVWITAQHRGSQVVIEIRDDGRGIDPGKMKARALERGLCSAAEASAMSEQDARELIFHPGFSTAEVVSEVSGRGVGMDVVKQTIVHQLKGAIDIESEVGRGSSFTLRLPLTLAIAQVLLARTGGETFAIPLDSVTRSIVVEAAAVQRIQNREVIAVRGRQVPLLRLNRLLGLEDHHDNLAREINVVLCHRGDELYGLVVEGLLGKKEIVIKSLGDVLENVPCTAGATLLGERCALILDVPALIQRAIQRAGVALPSQVERLVTETEEPRAGRPYVLVVEDSDTVRESLRRLLVQAGYRVRTARDGVEGLEAAREERFDLISTDVMMPRMDGYELTRALRAIDDYRDAPIIMVTSRGERIDRVRGFDAGVDEYITKPHDQMLLVRTVQALLRDKK